MVDLFARAHQMHQNALHAAMGKPSQSGAPAAPAAPGHSPGPKAAGLNNSAVDYGELAKKFGVHNMKLDSNPVVARTQLMQHLQQKFGPQYMEQPGVKDLLESYSQHNQTTPSARDTNSMTSQTERTVKALMG